MSTISVFFGDNFNVSLLAGYEPKIRFNSSSVLFEYPCGESNGCGPYKLSLPAGRFLFEVWGAQGGKGKYLSNPDGGKGGYCSGEITLQDTTLLFVHVGNIGRSAGEGGYNGGGDSAFGDFEGGSGGGATDIRLLQNNLSYRVIVAGGGGGSEHVANRSVYGWGGGIEGGYPYGSNKNGAHHGTQTKGGKNGGEFGKGGSCLNQDRGAGGGGWFGGGCGDSNIDGAGGSGFVFSSYPQISEEFKVPSQYKMKKARLVPGNDIIKNPITNIESIGNTGSGFARITLIKPNYPLPCTYKPMFRSHIAHLFTVMISVFSFSPT